MNNMIGGYEWHYVNNEEKVNTEEINMETALLLNIPFFERIEISDILL